MAILAATPTQEVLPAWTGKLQKSAQEEFARMVEELHTYVMLELETQCCKHVPEIEEKHGNFALTPECKSEIANRKFKFETEQSNPVLLDEGFKERVIEPFLLFSKKANMCFMQLKMTLTSRTESRSWTCNISNCTRAHNGIISEKFAEAQKSIAFQ